MVKPEVANSEVQTDVIEEIIVVEKTKEEEVKKEKPKVIKPVECQKCVLREVSDAVEEAKKLA